MSEEKKYTAQEAAIAVLKKAEEVLKKSGVLEKGHVGGIAGGAGRNKYQDQSEKQKGINLPHAAHSALHTGDLGTSDAGDHAKDTYGGKRLLVDSAKDKHKKVLGEMKTMPKPNLPKSEEAQEAQALEKAKIDGIKGKDALGLQLDRYNRKLGRDSDVHVKEGASKLQHEQKLISNKLSQKPSLPKSEEAQEAQASDKAFEVKPESAKSSDDARLSETQSPSENPKEEAGAPGNNEEWGTAPKTYSTLKLAKFMGRMEQKRSSKIKKD